MVSQCVVEGQIHEAVASYIEEQMENDFANIEVERFSETLKGHGRNDKITYYQLNVSKDLANREKWAGLKAIGVAIRYSESGDKWSTEVRYSINSIAMNVKRFARFVRGHWAIENTLHWCLDMTSTASRCAVALLAGWKLDYLAQVLGIPTV